MNELNYSLF